MKLMVELPVRQGDCYGSGEWDAPRGDKTHKAIDYECEPGLIVLSPIIGKVSKLGICYSDDLSFRYVEVTDYKQFRHRFFYVIPMVSGGDSVAVGQRLGRADDLRRRYPRDDDHSSAITNHIHYEIISPSGGYINPESR